MSQQKLTTPGTIAFDLVLTAIFFVFMTWLLVPFTFPSPMWGTYLQSAFAAMPITGVFFLALEMFRVTATDHYRRKKREQTENG